ncbi:hypothetical protein I312_102378 [Cryptococcus bacillisporus CA1280]|uniref:uncharacterized protein n=1 Tax=Cryptococcus bacillisporus CA1280 TaxID=1296109 RepID=UPI003366F8F7
MWTLHQLTENKATRSTADSPSPSPSPSVSRKGARISSNSPTGTPSLVKKENERMSSEKPDPSELEKDEDGPKPDVERKWEGFSKDVLEKWPALKKRNFWCIQRHSATALHYDLRMHLDGVTVSWAVPKGLLGISKSGEARRMAVETTLHPLWYTIHEGSDGRTFGQGRQGGTLLWDIGEYTIDLPSGYIPDLDTDEEEEAENRRRFKKRRKDSENDGREEEDKFRKALHRHIGFGKSRSIHFTLKGGKKMTNHSFILVLSSDPNKYSNVSPEGKEKKTWFITLPRGVDGYPWDQGGEDGSFYGRSVKSGMTFQQVYSSPLGLWKSGSYASHVAAAPSKAERDRRSQEHGIKSSSSYPDCLLSTPLSIPTDFMHLVFKDVLTTLVNLLGGTSSNLEKEHFVVAEEKWEEIGRATANSGNTIPSCFTARFPISLSSDRDVRLTIGRSGSNILPVPSMYYKHIMRFSELEHCTTRITQLVSTFAPHKFTCSSALPITSRHLDQIGFDGSSRYASG